MTRPPPGARRGKRKDPSRRGFPPASPPTLREQGPRYLHRVSRRMRRRGREGREGRRDAGREGTAPGEGRRGPRPGPGARSRARPSRLAEPSSAPRRRPAASRVPRRSRRALHQRPAEGRAGDHRPDRQGAAGTEGRAHHFAHRPAGPLPGVHADGRPHRRLAQDSERRGAPAPEAHPAGATAPASRAATSSAPRAKAAPKKNCAPT